MELNKKINETVFELSPDKKEKKYRDNKKFSLGFLTGFFVMALLAIGTVYAAISPIIKNQSIKNPITIDQAKIKAETFINENLMNSGSKIAIKGAEEKNGLYKISVNAGDAKDIDTYMTRDGKILILNATAIDMEKMENDKKNAPPATPTPTPIPLLKSVKPTVEIFVMSHCPFGTQIEKGILPAINAMGSKIKFDVKFTDYAMHGEKELKEQLNQYCIKTNEPAKFNTYLKCFIESAAGTADNSATCLKTTNINAAKLTTCVSATDKKFKVMANFADKTTWKGNFPTFDIYKEINAKYGVQGSPTLIINGVKAESERDPASLLKTICSAFNTPPKECDTVLSSDTPVAGFGIGAAANTNSASCGE